MRILAVIVSLIAAVVGVMFGLIMAFAPGAALFGVVPTFLMPAPAVLATVLVWFRPRTAALLLALSAIVTSVWPFAMTEHLSSSEQLSAETIAGRAAFVTIPSLLAAVAALLAWVSRSK